MNCMQSKPNQIPEKVKKAVKSIDKDAKVILFGSRASGDYGFGLGFFDPVE